MAEKDRKAVLDAELLLKSLPGICANLIHGFYWSKKDQMRKQKGRQSAASC